MTEREKWAKKSDGREVGGGRRRGCSGNVSSSLPHAFVTTNDRRRHHGGV